MYRRLFRPTYEGEPKTYTQEEVDEMQKDLHDQKAVDKIVEDRLSRDRKTREGKNAELITQLEAFKEQAGTSEEQRKTLEGQIESLRSEGQSKEQSLQREMNKATKKATKDLEGMTAERDHWQLQFAQQTVQTSIRAAATEHEALPQAHDQLVAILGSMNSRIAEVLGDDGKPTGQYQPVVTFHDKDDDGKPVVTESLAIPEAVKRMKELPDRFGNLFQTNSSGGLGGGTIGGGSSGKPNFAEMSMAEYRKQRDEGKGPAAQ